MISSSSSNNSTLPVYTISYIAVAYEIAGITLLFASVEVGFIYLSLYTIVSGNIPSQFRAQDAPKGVWRSDLLRSCPNPL